MRKFELAVFAGCLALLAYLAWHGFKGPRSFDHMAHLEIRLADLEAELAEARAQREARDRQVALLRPESIDPDMLDELARKTLEFAADDELVLPSRHLRP